MAQKGVVSEGQQISFKVSEDNQWHTVVIDLRTRIQDPGTYMVPNADGQYLIKALQIRPFSTNQPGAQPDDYTDIEYIAFFDDLNDLKNIVAEDKYEWSVDVATSPLKNTSDHSCSTHTLVENIEGTTHTVKCESCGNTVKTFTVPESINWFSSYKNMTSFQHKLDKFLYDEEAGVVYNRYSGTGGNHLNITGGAGAGAADKATFTAGQYLVMKYRANMTDGTLGLKISSNGVVGNDLKVSLGVRGFTEVHKDWTVVVIDLSELSSYTVGATGNFYAMVTASGGYVFDIAYMAVASSLDDVNALLEEGETYVDLGKSWAVGSQGGEGGGEQGGTTPTPPPASEHAITETAVDDGNGNVTYTWTCSHCAITKTITIPAAAKGYFSADKLANKSLSYFQLGSHKIEADEGADPFAYARFVGTDKIAQALWLRAQADCDRITNTGDLRNAENIDIGNSRYMIMRVRTNNASHPFRLCLSTTGKSSPTAVSTTGQEGLVNINGTALQVGDEYATATGYVGINIPLGSTAEGEWGVYVIDLTEVIPEYYVKDSETGTYILDTFYFHFDPIFAAATALDVSYVGFVESWDNIREMYGDELAMVKISSTSGDYGIVSSKDQSCADHKAVSSVDENGNYVSVCAACGEKMADYGIKAEALGGFFSAETLTSGGSPYGTFDREYLVEDGVPFMRLDNAKVGPDGWNGFTLINGDVNTYVGQYMVIKFRIGQNGLGQDQLKFFVSTKKNALTESSNVYIKASEDGEWHTVVIDLSTRVKEAAEYFVAEEGVYYVRYLQIRPFSTNQAGAQADDYMDISYIGFCDSLDDLKDIVGESYEWSESATDHTVKNILAE